MRKRLNRIPVRLPSRSARVRSGQALGYARDFGCGLPLRARPQSASTCVTAFSNLFCLHSSPRKCGAKQLKCIDWPPDYCC